MRLTPVVALCGGITVFSMLSGCRPVPRSERLSRQQIARGPSGMVVTSTPHATDAGVSILELGGNAVDAAVAAAFTLAVAEPSMSGLGGRTQILLRANDGEFYGIDGTTQVPSGYPGSTGSLRSGYAMVGVPGTVAALTQALEDHGTLPLSTVLQPAIDLAENGFPLDSGEAERIGSAAQYLMQYEGSRQYFMAGGSPMVAGYRWRQPELAATLRAIAQGGREAFYRGDVAQRMAQDIAANGGFVTEEDLAAYDAVSARVVRGSYRGYGLAGLSMPAAGATTIEILQILEQFELASMSESEWAFHVVEALRLGYEDWFADHGSLQEKVALILSTEWATTRAREIGQRASVLAPSDASDGNTAHLTVVDGNGGAVALTQSLGPAMGSRVATPGLGFVYAATMGYLTQTEPGARASSFISPFFVLRDGAPAFVLGAAGARRIVTSIVESLSRAIDRGYSFADAVAAPRMHPDDDTLVVEHRLPAYTWPDSLLAVFRERGWPVRHEESAPYFGRIHGVQIVDGERFGVADPRWDGTARASGGNH